ncbi:MAG: hypothetical protein ACRECO_13180 [Xanthobacteraceae bacterium]
MLAHVKKNTVPITIGVSFFVFGFFVTANVLNLSEREVVIGLIAGAVGGTTTLVSMLWQERKDAQEPASAV